MSKTNRVAAMEKTPSLNASIRDERSDRGTGASCPQRGGDAESDPKRPTRGLFEQPWDGDPAPPDAFPISTRSVEKERLREARSGSGRLEADGRRLAPPLAERAGRGEPAQIAPVRSPAPEIAAQRRRGREAGRPDDARRAEGEPEVDRQDHTQPAVVLGIEVDPELHHVARD